MALELRSGRFFEAQGFMNADANNIFRIEVGVDDVLTLTTSPNRGHKGDQPSQHSSAAFPQSYEDDLGLCERRECSLPDRHERSF